MLLAMQNPSDMANGYSDALRCDGDQIRQIVTCRVGFQRWLVESSLAGSRSSSEPCPLALVTSKLLYCVISKAKHVGWVRVQPMFAGYFFHIGKSHHWKSLCNRPLPCLPTVWICLLIPTRTIRLYCLKMSPKIDPDCFKLGKANPDSLK